MLLQILASLALASTALCAPTTNALGRRVNHDSLNPIVTRVQSGPLGAAIEKFNPRLHIASGCQPYTAVDDAGNTKQATHSGGLKPSGSQTGGCGDTTKGQTYARATTLASGNVAIMYSWYMPKDQTVDDVAPGSHRHEFENVVVFLGSNMTAVLGGAASGHGDYKVTPGALPGGDSANVEYFATFPTNHELQFTQTVGKTYPVSDWDAMPAVARAALQNNNFGEASPPFKDGDFEANLAEIALG